MAEKKPAAGGAAPGAAGAKKKKSARHPSAIVRARRNVRRAAINKSRTSKMRTAVKDVETAIAAGDKKKAQAALSAAASNLHRGAQKGVIHANTASRTLSRLNARVKALGA
jgi:small subunit ribosomal protein S20